MQTHTFDRGLTAACCAAIGDALNAPACCCQPCADATCCTDCCACGGGDDARGTTCA